MKKLLSFIIVVCMIIVSVPMSVSAADICTPYNGDNEESQDYSLWSSTVKSYLSKTSDGKIMKVQAGDTVNGVMIEYYDTSYNLLSNRVISTDLPVFGGFYESNSNYFLVTGKENPNEISDVKVFSVTKYDKAWNNLGSVGIYNANTTLPFDSGSLRMTMYNNILFVHTAHKMYKTGDGYNHQGNIMFSVDTNSMEVIQCNSSALNTSIGYVSHSFNQFVQMDGNNVVTVDHGDAYNRSIVLIKHSMDASKGNFGSNCEVTDVLEFPGTRGDNYTGASIGGFEISSSSYLIAGNTVEQNDNYANNKTRNIFVASVNKSDETNNIKINKITNYSEGQATASTPHFVKIANDEYMLMWSRNNTVYYTVIDRNGGTISNIYTMNGSLSDCAPTVINNKLVWYVWKDTKTIFHEIDLDVISSTKTTTVESGHDNEFLGVNGSISTLRCKKCGETTTTSVPTEMAVGWALGSSTSGEYYINLPETKMGDSLKNMIVLSPVSGQTNTDVEVIISDESIMSYEVQYSYPYYNYWYILGEFKFLKPGTTNVTIRHKYNHSLANTYQVNITVDPTDVTFKESEISMNIDDVYNLTPIFTPVGASSLCAWSSSDTSVATVDNTGTVTAKAAGTTVITLTTANGLRTTCKITVKNPVLGDINGDGIITVVDAVLVMRYNIGKLEFNESQIKSADIDFSGNIDVIDVILIQKRIVE